MVSTSCWKLQDCSGSKPQNRTEFRGNFSHVIKRAFPVGLSLPLLEHLWPKSHHHSQSTVDLWRTRVWTVLVHLHVFFPPSKCTENLPEPQLVESLDVEPQTQRPTMGLENWWILVVGPGINPPQIRRDDCNHWYRELDHRWRPTRLTLRGGWSYARKPCEEETDLNRTGVALGRRE